MKFFAKDFKIIVSTHSRLKAAGSSLSKIRVILYVSTHSRLKAAGLQNRHAISFQNSFNTQPPEGGWVRPAPRTGSTGIDFLSK